MSTQRQIQANRLNAQKSTGPRTPEGKAVSSQNAFKSGLDAESQFVYGESREDFYALQQEYAARFNPVAPEERFQVDTLIRDEWLLRRLFRAEAHLWEYHVIRASRSEQVPLGEALVNGSAVFMRLQRRVTLLERSYKEAYAELERLQAARQAAPDPSPEPQCVAVSPPPAGPQPLETITPAAKLGSFLTGPSMLAAGPAALPLPADRPPRHVLMSYH